MKFWYLILWAVLGCLTLACNRAKEEENKGFQQGASDRGGAGNDFKIPLLPGYNWEVTQSWGEHCEACDDLYPYDPISYCDDTHMLESDYYSWDFNLPNNEDLGKETLASADGTVQQIGYDADGWGNYLIIDHGNNVCSRYAHLLNPSPLSAGQEVCQGLVVGQIGNTGNSTGPHLHFQFEECDTAQPLAMGFTDGNEVPMCTKGDDVTSNNQYVALQLTNVKRVDCDNEENPPGEADLDESGWSNFQCGGFPGCPLNQNCNRGYNHHFSDENTLSQPVIEAANYLYAECAVNGYQDGTLRGNDRITRAEALKIPMELFSQVKDNCANLAEPFTDVNNGDWFKGPVACALSKGIINQAQRFRPNNRVNVAEAVKMAVMSGVAAGKIQIYNPNFSSFSRMPVDHWAHQYMETLFHYGAPIDLEVDPVRSVGRGEFMSMVAALSPCFCANVDCDGGCQCSQSTYSCSRPDAEGTDVGGGDEEDGDTQVASNPFNLDITCYTKPAFQECSGQSYNYVIGCEMHNGGNQSVFVNRLTLHIDNTSDRNDCQFPQPTTNANGVGTQRVDPGQNVRVSGGLTMTCSREPADGNVSITIDLTTRQGGVSTLYSNAAWSNVTLERGMVATCQQAAQPSPPPSTPPPPPPPANLARRNADGTCNFNGLYTLYLFSQNATMEIQTARGEYVNTALYNDQWTIVQMECAELPLAILLHGGITGAWVSTDPATSGAAQPLEVNFWAPYEGGITTHPRVPATGHVRHSSFGGAAGRNLLIGVGF